MGKRDRGIDVDEIIDSIKASLLKLAPDPDELAAVLADLANSASLPNAVFKRARIDLPSFSIVKWSNFARQHGLAEDPSFVDLESFQTPRYLLPPSLHQVMAENAWHWQDAYREKVDHESEEAKVRLLDPYIVQIVALFQGRVVDKPELTMAKNKYATGGDVEHKVFMIGGILFFVIELKRGTPDPHNLAQLFLELLSAAERNRGLDFDGLRIYGLLTDLNQFKFYSYDPPTEEFSFDETILINTKRVDALSDMIDVANKIFGVILSAYVDGLRARNQRRQDRVGCNDFSLASSAPGSLIGQSASSLQKPSELTGARRKGSVHGSTDQWDAALVFANSCVEKFGDPVASLQDIEERANSALELLTKSVRSIPRASFFSGKGDGPSTPAELKTMTAKVIKEEHEHYLSTISQ